MSHPTSAPSHFERLFSIFLPLTPTPTLLQNWWSWVMFQPRASASVPLLPARLPRAPWHPLIIHRKRCPLCFPWRPAWVPDLSSPGPKGPSCCIFPGESQPRGIQCSLPPAALPTAPLFMTVLPHSRFLFFASGPFWPHGLRTDCPISWVAVPSLKHLPPWVPNPQLLPWCRGCSDHLGVLSYGVLPGTCAGLVHTWMCSGPCQASQGSPAFGLSVLPCPRDVSEILLWHLNAVSQTVSCTPKQLKNPESARVS